MEKIIVAFVNSFFEELQTKKSLKKLLFLTLRIISLIICTICTGFLFLAALLTEHGGSNTQIMSLYICIIYTLFLLGNHILPWKIISINKTLSICYLIILPLSFAGFCLLQLISLLFHEKSIKWNSLIGVYPIFFIPLFFSIVLFGLFFWNYKIYYEEQKNKNLNEEWNRLSIWSWY